MSWTSHIEQHEQLASTQDRAFALAEAGAEQGTAVLARLQTAARGQFHRPWFAAPGGLWLSLLMYPPAKLLGSGNLSLLGAAAVAELLSELGCAEERIKIKHPNDVLIDGKKIAGVLLETRSSLPAVVLGIGLNVSFALSDFPAELRDTASSVQLALGHAPSNMLTLAQRLRQLLYRNYQQLQAGQFTLGRFAMLGLPSNL